MVQNDNFVVCPAEEDVVLQGERVMGVDKNTMTESGH